MAKKQNKPYVLFWLSKCICTIRRIRIFTVPLLGIVLLGVIFIQLVPVLILKEGKVSRELLQIWHNPHVTKRQPVFTSYPQNFHLDYDNRTRKICQLGKGLGNLITVLFMVHSRPGNIKSRSIIRQTFTNQSYFPDHTIRVIFLVGKPSDNETQVTVEKEFSLYNDIVQGRFIDSYRNLSLKAVTGLRWITENCPNVSMVVKLDDDVIINTFNLLDLVLPNSTAKTFICRPRPEDTAAVIRLGKWRMNRQYLMNYRYYPWTYCGGAAVFITGDLIPLLYKASLTAPLLWVDDLYLTGVVASRIHGITIEQRPHSLNFKQTETCFSQPGCKYLFGVAKQPDMGRVWNSLLLNRHITHGGST